MEMQVEYETIFSFVTKKPRCEAYVFYPLGVTPRNPICGSYSFYNFQQFKSYIQTINYLYWIPKHPHIQATSILHLLALTI